MQHKHSSLFAAYFILFLDNLGYAILFQILPLIFIDPSYHFLPQETIISTRNILLSLLLAIFPLAQFFAAPIFGDIADRCGRKKVLFWLLLGSFIGYCFTAAGLAFKLYYLLFLSRLFSGIFGCSLAISMAIVADLSPYKSLRGKRLGTVAALIGLGWLIALLLGTVFTNPLFFAFVNSSLLFWILPAFSILNMIVLFTCYREPEKTNLPPNLFKGIHRIVHLLEMKHLRTFYLVFFFWFLGYLISLQWIFPVSIEKFQVSEGQIIALLLSWGCIWVFSSGFLNRWLINRLSLWPLNLWTLFGLSLFLFFSGVSNFFLFFAITYVVGGMFAALTWGNTLSLISLAIRQEEQGKGMGIALSMFSLTQIFGPFLGGTIAGFSIGPLFYGCSLLAFISFLLLLIYVVRPRRPSTKKFFIEPIRR